MISLHWPLALLLLPAPLFMHWHGFYSNQQQALATPFFCEDGLTQLISTKNDANAPFSKLLCGLIWCLLVFALARPEWLGQPFTSRQTGRDILFATDLSASMQIKDMLWNNRTIRRIDAVKLITSAFIDKRRGDRIGLILFGSRAFLHAPLSFDTKTVKQFLNESQVGLAGNLTALGDAIGLAIKYLHQANAKEKVLILMTDGENTAGDTSPQEAAGYAKAAGVKIYCIGIGASPMIQANFYTQSNPYSAPKVNESQLSALAEATGGHYYRAENSHQLANSYKTIAALEPMQHESEIVRPVKPYYNIPLAIAVLLSVGLITTHTQWRHRVYD